MRKGLSIISSIILLLISHDFYTQDYGYKDYEFKEFETKFIRLIESLKDTSTVLVIKGNMESKGVIGGDEYFFVYHHNLKNYEKYKKRNIKFITLDPSFLKDIQNNIECFNNNYNFDINTVEKSTWFYVLYEGQEFYFKFSGSEMHNYFSKENKKYVCVLDFLLYF